MRKLEVFNTVETVNQNSGNRIEIRKGICHARQCADGRKDAQRGRQSNPRP